MTNALLFIAVIAVICGLIRASKLQRKNDALNRQLQAAEDALEVNISRINLLESRDKQLIQNASEALFVFSQETGMLLEINLQAEGLLGYTQGEVSNLTYKVLFSR